MGEIKDPEIWRMAEEYASTIDQPVEEAIKTALQLAMEARPRPPSAEEQARRVARIMEISRQCAALPDYDTRSPDEILGYDENGLPS